MDDRADTGGSLGPVQRHRTATQSDEHDAPAALCADCDDCLEQLLLCAGQAESGAVVPFPLDRRRVQSEHQDNRVRHFGRR
jgi:hypothetical protein